MADLFLDWIRKRRTELKRELEELDASEKTYLKSGMQERLQPGLPMPRPEGMAPTEGPRLTIKEMVLKVLGSAPSYGLTANEILDRIRLVFDPTITRTSLSPQLSRLKDEEKIASNRPYWSLVTPTNESGKVEPGSVLRR